MSTNQIHIKDSKMYYVGIDIAKTFSVTRVINDKEEMIINPFPFKSTSTGFKMLLNNLNSLDCDKSNILNWYGSNWSFI